MPNRNAQFKKWEEMYNRLNDRIERQKVAITRLVGENVAMSSALKEIADARGLQAGPLRSVAVDCLEAINAKRSNQQESEGLESPDEPKEDTE